MPFRHLSTKGSKRVVAVQPYWKHSVQRYSTGANILCRILNQEQQADAAEVKWLNC